MRIESVSLLVLAAFALAACAGTPTTGSTASNASLGLCGLACPFGTPTGGSGGGGTAPNDPADGDDSSTDGGNTTDLSPLTADTTIALESSRLVRPSGSTPSLSLLTAGTSPTTTTAQILSGTKPTQLTIAVDTNSGTNDAWPTPAQMDVYDFGTNAADPTGGNKGGAGTGYREYRVYSANVGEERDESLQVWAWGDSYATQYRVTPNGGEAAQQAWSFGGNKTPLAAMPVAGSATYNGRFVGTAKTANYLKPSAADINPNALWRVQGASQVVANFGTAGVTGTLTPETWTSFQEGISDTFMQTIGGPFVPGYGLSSGPGTLTAIQAPNYSFYNTTIALAGTITGNTYAGTTAGSATLSGPFISGDETMYGGFFGDGSETTGVFHVTGMDPYPVGGSAGINDDKRAYLTIQGAFNANCTSGVGACP